MLHMQQGSVLYVCTKFQADNSIRSEVIRGGLKLGHVTWPNFKNSQEINDTGTTRDVSILDFIAAKDDRVDDDNLSSKMCKAPVKSSTSTNQHQLLQAGCPSRRPTNTSAHPKLTSESSKLVIDR